MTYKEEMTKKEKLLHCPLCHGKLVQIRQGIYVCKHTQVQHTWELKLLQTVFFDRKKEDEKSE